MHGPDRVAAGISALAPLTQPGEEATEQTLETWRGYADRLEEGGARATERADARDAVRWHAAVDFFLFAPALAFTLVLLALRADLVLADAAKRLSEKDFVRRRFDESGMDVGRAFEAYRKLPLFAALAASAYLAADEAENILAWLLVERSWPKTDITAWEAWSLWTLAWAKWIALGLAAAALVIVARPIWLCRPAGGGSVLTALVRLRAQLVIVGTFALALLFHEQIPDAIRHWGAGQLAYALLFSGSLAVLTWLLGRRLALLDRDPSRERVPLPALLGLIGLAGVVVAVHFLSPVKVGWGLAVPAAILLGLLLLSAPLPALHRETAAQRASTPPLSGENALARGLGALVLAVLGLAALRAGFGFAVYVQDWALRDFGIVTGSIAAPLAAAVALGRLRKPRWWSEPLLWGAGGLALGVGVVRAVSDRPELPPSVLVAVAVLLPIAAWRFYNIAERVDDGWSGSLWLVVAVAAVPALVLWGLVVEDVWTTAEHVGSVALLGGFLCALSLVAGVLVWLSHGVAPPEPFRVFLLRRTPVLAIVAAWFVAASVLDPGGYHDVRVTGPQGEAARGITLHQAFACWLGRNGLPAVPDRRPEDACPVVVTASASPRAAQVTPLVFVATSGGGSRAAYWTALVMDCVFEDAGDTCPSGKRTPAFVRSRSLFVASGISGGALGLASYTAYLADKEDQPATWVRDRLGGDSLAAPLAWALFVEVPRIFLRFDEGPDRAEVLEQAWERAWDGGLSQGLFSVWRAHQQTPVLVLGGTSVEDGCRFSASVLDANVERDEQVRNCTSLALFDGDRLIDRPSALAATRDLVDFLCEGQDVRLSTAALLSARFPLVSPSGRLEWCGRRADKPVTYVVDGGYLDTSGASAALELWERLRPSVADYNAEHGAEACVVPYFIQIDGYEGAVELSRTKRPFEFNVPGQTLLATRTARAANARGAAALEFTQAPKEAGIGAVAPSQTDRYAHFTLQAHPGPNTPLGWVLSEASRRDLVEQLLLERNLDELRRARAWFDRPAGCG